jgi:hypothetical protein
MPRDDRHERLLRIKALGRIAYRHLKDAEIVGIIVGAEEKRMQKFKEDGLSAELLEPFRSGALLPEHSQIWIRYFGRKVLDIRWDRASSVRAVTLSRASGRGADRVAEAGTARMTIATCVLRY